MKLRSKHIAPIVLAAFVIGIGGSMAFNLWKTESSKEPALIREGDFAGEYNPADIRGSYSLSDVSKAFGIPVEVLAVAFAVSDLDNPGEFQLKELEEIYEGSEIGEVGTDSMRLFVSLYTGLPHTPEETTLLLKPAEKVLKEHNPELGLIGVTFVRPEDLGVTDIAAAAESAGEAEEDHDTEEEAAVKGNTTFTDLYTWGLTEEEVEDVLGTPPGPSGTTVRDFLMEKGLEFGEYKTKLQELVDSK